VTGLDVDSAIDVDVSVVCSALGTNSCGLIGGESCSVLAAGAAKTSVGGGVGGGGEDSCCGEDGADDGGVDDSNGAGSGINKVELCLDFIGVNVELELPVGPYIEVSASKLTENLCFAPARLDRSDEILININKK
jgi:hypothetical protein